MGQASGQNRLGWRGAVTSLSYVNLNTSRFRGRGFTNLDLTASDLCRLFGKFLKHPFDLRRRDVKSPERLNKKGCEEEIQSDIELSRFDLVRGFGLSTIIGCVDSISLRIAIVKQSVWSTTRPSCLVLLAITRKLVFTINLQIWSTSDS